MIIVNTVVRYQVFKVYVCTEVFYEHFYIRMVKVIDYINRKDFYNFNSGNIYDVYLQLIGITHEEITFEITYKIAVIMISINFCFNFIAFNNMLMAVVGLNRFLDICNFMGTIISIPVNHNSVVNKLLGVKNISD